MITPAALVSNNFLIYAYNYMVVVMVLIVCLWLLVLTYGVL